jgi:predicted DNA-binding transcriptional regulator AlpA
MRSNQLPTTNANRPGREHSTPPQSGRLIRLHEVCELTALGKTSIYSIPDFPKRIILSRRAVGWRLSEVLAWIESRSTVGA